MTDPYNRFSAVPSTGTFPGPGRPAYLSPELPSLESRYLTSASMFNSSYLQRETSPLISRLHALDEASKVQSCNNHGIGGFSGAGGKMYTSSIDDSNLLNQRGGTSTAIASPIPDGLRDRPSSLRSSDGLQNAIGHSNILFVGGLPTNCTRREVGHLFRPFIGYKDIKVIHKEPRQVNSKAKVYCFVEFEDGKCALTAMEALQGYKFDDKKPDSAVLKIHFAHFPFCLPSDSE